MDVVADIDVDAEVDGAGERVGDVSWSTLRVCVVVVVVTEAAGRL